MKRLITALALSLTCIVSFGATTTPVSLLNPSGSAAGQAIISTGASSAPVWGAVPLTGITGTLAVSHGGTGATTASGAALDNITGFSGTGFLTRTGAGTYAFQSTTNGVTLGNLAQVGANTVLANGTGATANVTALAMPSCSTSANALLWTSGTGFTCNTGLNALTLAGSTFASPASIGSTTANSGAFTTLSATGLISPSSTVGIKGTATNDSAQAGSVGEYVTNSATGVTAFGSNAAGNVTSISLTAGDWDVQGTVLPAGGTVTAVGVGISTTSATFGSLGTYASAVVSGSNGVAVSPTVRISVASTTTVYLIGNAVYSVAPTMSGLIRARRVR